MELSCRYIQEDQADQLPFRTSDGLTLIATSQDGYASLFTFDEGELGTQCATQPERLVSPLEQTDLFKANTSSPIKQLEPSSRANGPQNSASASNQKVVQGILSSPVRKDDQDIIMLDGPPSSAAKGTNGDEAGTEKKVKKRAALTTMPLA